jgi:hypothetical protein
LRLCPAQCCGVTDETIESHEGISAE